VNQARLTLAACAALLAISLMSAAAALGAPSARPSISSPVQWAPTATYAASVTRATAGSGWTQQSSGTTQSLLGVSCVNGGLAWACGQKATLLRTADGGVTWTRMQSAMASDDEASAIEFVNSQTGWALGAHNAILRTTNGGASWSSQSFLASLYPPHLLALTAVDPSHAWIGGYYLTAGTYSDYHNVVLRTTDGAAWSMAANLLLPGGPGEGIVGISFPDLSHGFAVTVDGGIARTYDGGAVWQVPVNYNGVSSLNDIDFADAQNGWAVGENSSSKGLILHTSNGGTQWYVQGPASLNPLPIVRAVCAVSPSVAWFACEGGYVLHTLDAGASWYVERPTTQDVLGISFVTADTGWAVGGGGAILRHGEPYVAPTPSPSSNPAPNPVAGKPVLSKLSPARGRVGKVVVLTGRNFGATRASSTVKFGAKKVSRYLSWSTARIKVKVPNGTHKGWVKVTVRTKGGTSAARMFLRK
jgi:photosystem II stability/assembly factor-like uncharacterized protein